MGDDEDDVFERLGSDELGDGAGDGDEEEEPLPRIDEVLKALPLIQQDLYLGMQAMNLTIVDSIIEEMESDLLSEYIRIERTPVMSVMMVSALSQLWIFGVYELLRTWRQRLRDVLKFADGVASLDGAVRDAKIADKESKLKEGVDRLSYIPHADAYRKAALDGDYRESLRTALYKSEIPFRRIESLRLHLAKHEMPKRHGIYGAGAGYSRIDHDGSIQYHVPLGDNELDLISRSQIARDIRQLADDRPLFVLSQELQAKVRGFPQHSYGIKRVVLTLTDGSKFQAAIAWDTHIVFVRGYGMPPFPAEIVVDLEPMKPGEEFEAEEQPEG